MRLRRILILCAVLVNLNCCQPVYYSKILYQVRNDLNENVMVKVYNVFYLKSDKKDTVLTLNPNQSGQICDEQYRGEIPNDLEILYTNNRVDFFDSLIVEVISTNAKSKKKFDAKPDWEFIKDNAYNARYVLTVDESDF